MCPFPKASFRDGAIVSQINTVVTSSGEHLLDPGFSQSRPSTVTCNLFPWSLAEPADGLGEQ